MKIFSKSSIIAAYAIVPSIVISMQEDLPGLTMSESNAIASIIEREEGFVPHPYNDFLGFGTIGYGTLLPLDSFERSYLGLDSIPKQVTKEQARWLLKHRLSQSGEEFAGHWMYYLDQPHEIRAALLDAVYQLGWKGLLGFRNSLKALHEGRCQDSINGFNSSLWAKQTPPRVKHLTSAIREHCNALDN